MLELYLIFCERGLRLRGRENILFHTVFLGPLYLGLAEHTLFTEENYATDMLHIHSEGIGFKYVLEAFQRTEIVEFQLVDVSSLIMCKFQAGKRKGFWQALFSE